MIINTNMSAMNTLRQLGVNEKNTQGSLAKLSSGLRINSAADDAAGLAISEKMRGQISGLNKASSNAQDGISLTSTAEGALNETTSILQRMRELSVQAGNDTSTATDRAAMQTEVKQLKSEIDRIANTTQFNTKNLLDGSLQGATTAQGSILNSVAMTATATQGLSTSTQAVATTTNIVTGANDTINLAVDGGGATTITIAQGQYTSRSGLAAAVNAAIGGTALAGKVTASIDSNGKMAFTSTTSGATSGVAVTAGATDASATLGYSAAGITAAVDDTAAVNAGHALVAGVNDSVKLTVGGKTIDNIVLTGLANFQNNAATVTALQTAFDTNFGTNAVTVSLNGNSIRMTSSVGNVAIAAATTRDIGFAAADTITQTTAYAAAFNAGTVTAGTAASGTASGTTLLTGLGDSSGNNLGLKAGNQINVSFLVGGVQKNTTLAVNGATTLASLATAVQTALGNASSVTVGTNGKLSVQGQQGQSFEISNMQFTAQNSSSDTTAVQGQFNNKFSNFTETQVAQDTHADSSLTFQIGANQGQTINVDINRMDTQALALSSVDVSTQQGAAAATSVIDNAINAVSSERAKLGAVQNRLQHTINNLGTSSQNISSAEANIRDVDMAHEMTNFQKNNVLQQAAQAMLAQANQQPSQVLQLLR